ncbi:MAG: hypothetical protein A2W01_12520 [Candidatus Solincola sediminis]|uniref:N-(5'-phosphoribosyl)anthranilate isomerase n=1 Tax=Candidatus Solincola sediminis TaxID=1797199 RepID=A0A1F2WK93_9ACTN|nr:MAG: hypothetical protein A2W01_12520 [Candidatus Solincola sediminis]OFW57244.1 MAG: hypothetical protein A2Y75_07380 [Candidatus Solincola sediminis]
MTWLKVCGIRRSEEASAACRIGFDAIGMVFTESTRRVSPDQAREISEHLPPSILRVGIFANNDPGEIRKIFEYCHLDLVQLHGDEASREASKWGTRAIKAIRPRHPEDLEQLDQYADNFAVLIDSWDPFKPGGTGVVGDWSLAESASARARIILAGGLRPLNVGRAISSVRPFGVDVSTGVESAPGIKDEKLMRDFAREAGLAAGGRLREDRDAGTGN